jgi:hypothetical protein
MRFFGDCDSKKRAFWTFLDLSVNNKKGDLKGVTPNSG